MSNLRAKISRATSKKVPILALVVVAMFGMVVGVLAANLTVAQTNNTGEIGTYHTSTGTMVITDNGLGVVANGGGGAAASATFPANGLNTNVNNALTSGDWFEKIMFTDNAVTDNTAHTATVTIRNGTGITGTQVVSTSFTLTGPGATSTGTITAYVDTGVTSLTSPITVYVTIT
jgi:hypothetical protein